MTIALCMVGAFVDFYFLVELEKDSAQDLTAPSGKDQDGPAPC
jgi:hypothetical protein